MKKNKVYILYFLLAMAFLFGACRKIIDAKDLPEQDVRLVLNSVISKDSSIKANVSLSKSILSGKDYKLIDNATCELYINDQYTETLVNFKNGNYQSTLKGKANTKYTLKVIAGGYKTAEGSNTMTDSAGVLRIERFDTINYTIRRTTNVTYTFLGGGLRYRLFLKDKALEDNYFTLQPMLLLYDSLGHTIDHELYFYVSNIDNSQYGSSIKTFGSNVFFDDKYLVNGNEIPLSLELGFNDSSPLTSHVYAIEFVLYVSNVSEDYFKYIVTLNNQIQTNNQGTFFAEPVIVHNNIINGMGIVGCVNTRTISLGRKLVYK